MNPSLNWDKDKKQSRARRKCIGRLDPDTKKIVHFFAQPVRDLKKGVDNIKHQV